MEFSNSGNFRALPDEMITEIFSKFRKNKECFPFSITCKRIARLWQKRFETRCSEIIITNVKMSSQTLKWYILVNKNRDQFVMVVNLPAIQRIKSDNKLPTQFIIGKMKKRRSWPEIRKFIKLGWLSFMVQDNTTNLYIDKLLHPGCFNSVLHTSYSKKSSKVEKGQFTPEFYTYCSMKDLNASDYLEGW